MFGLYRRCCSIKDNISVNCMDNGSSINTFTNSSNISTIPSSILYNRMYRSETGKIMNVLLLLFFVFGSCVVSFGMENQQPQIHENNMNESIEKLEKNDMNENKENEKQQQVQFGSPMLHPPPKVDGPVDIAPRDQYLGVPSIINKISMLFLTKVMGVNENGMKDEIDNAKELFFWFSLLGLSDVHFCYGRNNRGVLLIFYSISTILANSLYRGLFSVKPCLKIIKEGWNCELYLGVGDVPYVGWLFNLSLVCKPTFILKYLHLPLNDKVTIHIFDLKPFNFILGYNISLNVGSWIVDLITFMKYTKKANEKVLKINIEPQDIND